MWTGAPDHWCEQKERIDARRLLTVSPPQLPVPWQDCTFRQKSHLHSRSHRYCCLLLFLAAKICQAGALPTAMHRFLPGIGLPAPFWDNLADRRNMIYTQAAASLYRWESETDSLRRFAISDGELRQLIFSKSLSLEEFPISDGGTWPIPDQSLIKCFTLTRICNLRPVFGQLMHKLLRFEAKTLSLRPALSIKAKLSSCSQLRSVPGQSMENIAQEFGNSNQNINLCPAGETLAMVFVLSCYRRKANLTFFLSSWLCFTLIGCSQTIAAQE